MKAGKKCSHEHAGSEWSRTILECVSQGGKATGG